MRSDGRLPLIVLGGFLGAGKSTWLRHQLSIGAFARHYVLVNEAARTPIDNLLLSGAHRLGVLAAGCACCEGRAALVAMLRDICDSAAREDLEGIVLETTGLADPAAIAAAVAGDPVLVRRLAVTQTIALIDAQYGLDQLNTEPLARAQAEAADQLILTKAHSSNPLALARLTATLGVLNPGAHITAAERGESAPLPAQDAPPHVLTALGPTVPIRAHRLMIGEAGGWAALSTWLSALLHARGAEVVRVKGVVSTPAGQLLIQSVRHLVQPPEIIPEDETGMAGPIPELGTLVLIGRGIDECGLARSWAWFDTSPGGGSRGH